VCGHGACLLGGGSASLFVFLGLAWHALLDMLQLRIENTLYVITHFTRQGVVLTLSHLLIINKPSLNTHTHTHRSAAPTARLASAVCVFERAFWGFEDESSFSHT